MTSLLPKPKVIALGGAGIKIATRLRDGPLQDFDILGIDLTATAAPFEVLSVGGGNLEFLGSGGDPEVTLRAVEEKKPDIETKLQGTSLLFIIAGLGGGTASALAPMIAEMASRAGALVFAFVSLPFSIEGSRRSSQAKEALSALRQSGAVVIPLPNDILLRWAPEGSTATHAIELADKNIGKGIRGITAMIYTPGLLEVDFESIKRTFTQSKNAKTIFSFGEGFGAGALSQVYSELTSCPLLQAAEVARSADHLLLSVKVSGDIGLKEVMQLTQQLAEKFGVRSEKIVGAVISTDWNEPRIEAVFIGQPDLETRRRQTAALQNATLISKASRQKAEATPNPQTEFSFNTLLEQRGFFENTELNLYRGEDVDVPTYLRRSVKVVL